MVSYDSPRVATEKVSYIKQLGLGGAMWWETSGDKAAEQGGLINTVTQGMGGFEGRHMEKIDNVLEYPQSKYDNLRNGMPGS